MSSLIQKAINAIIRPPRKEYSLSAIPLFFESGDHRYIRQPLTFVNNRNQKIVGSLYQSADMNPLRCHSCLIYLHGNASCQFEGQFLVPNFCNYGVYVFCFDFVGCGNSDGEYISLGYYEKQDVEFLISTLNKTFGINQFVLWGRSMGAVTSLLAKSDMIKAVICDSSFTSITDLCRSIGNTMNFPKAFVGLVIWFLKRRIIKKANFDVRDVAPIESVKTMNTPVVFGHAEDDISKDWNCIILVFQRIKGFTH